MINELMLEEHGKILSALNEAKQDFRKFAFFKEQLEEHFSVEESVIFSFYISMYNNDIGNFFELLKDHGMILGLVRSIEKKPGNFGELEEMLINHASLENGWFYPRLDKLLDEDQKIGLVKKIRETLNKENIQNH
jgi:hemerythrin-like domain-containing protein